MSNEFYTILTNAGLAAIANASVSNSTVDFAKVAVGDGNGTYYTPTRDMTALRNQKWIGPVASVAVDENNPNWVNVEAVIPAIDGGFYIREIGIFNEANVLLAIGKLPETYKPEMESGSTKDLYLKAIFEVTNASVISLKADPSVVLASRKYVDDKVAVVSGNLTSIQNQLTSHLAQSKEHNHYATSSTAASTNTKTATLSGFTLQIGTHVAVKFTNANTATSPTLNVNSTGAKPIYQSGTAGARWSAGEVVEFVYDGTNYCVLGYTKPSNGIPKTDLATAVQTSLNKADTALQSVADASTTQKGITQLSSATNSDAENLAATPKAVKAAFDRAAAVDSAQVNLINYKSPTALPSEYPIGISVFRTNLEQSNEWINEFNLPAYTTINKRVFVTTEKGTGGFGTIQTLTYYSGNASNNTSNELLGTFKRGSYHDSGWGPWQKVLTQVDYDQLFQYANDGKTAVATAINGKGGSVNSSDTFATLASAISGLGIIPASGTGTLTSSNTSTHTLDVSGLPFRPKIILVRRTSIPDDRKPQMGLFVDDSLIPGMSVGPTFMIDYNFTLQSTNFIVTNSGFTFNLKYLYGTGAGDYAWIALG